MFINHLDFQLSEHLSQFLQEFLKNLYHCHFTITLIFISEILTTRIVCIFDRENIIMMMNTFAKLPTDKNALNLISTCNFFKGHLDHTLETGY